MNKFLTTLLGVAFALSTASIARAESAPPSGAPQASVVYGYVLNPTGKSKPEFCSFSLSTPAQIEEVYVPTNSNNGEGGGAMTPNGYLVMTKPTSFSSYLYGYYYNMNPWSYNKSISGKDNGTN